MEPNKVKKQKKNEQNRVKMTKVKMKQNRRRMK